MPTKIILLITLLAYSMIVSQSFMYILSLKYVQNNLDAEAYTGLRKLTDTSMRANFKYVIYGTLFTNLVLVIITAKNPGSLLFITATIALLAIIVDTLITVKGNIPVNDIINGWSKDNIPGDWATYRTKWLTIFQYRQVANITGFVSLLIGTVFGTR